MIRPRLALVVAAAAVAFGAGYAVEHWRADDAADGPSASAPRPIGRYTPVAVPAALERRARVPALRGRKHRPAAAPAATAGPAPAPVVVRAAPPVRSAPAPATGGGGQGGSQAPSSPAPQGNTGRKFFGSK